MNLSKASQIAFTIAAYEAQALKNKFIDTEHFFLGLCKIEDIIAIGKEAIQNITEKEWEGIYNEIAEFKEFLLSKGIEPKKTRRRLRKIIYESDLEKGEFSGHRTQRCREVFKIAEEICVKEQKEEIELRHFFLAILIQGSNLLDRLFSDLSIEKEKLYEGIPLIEKKDETTPKKDSSVIVAEKEKEEVRSIGAKTPYLDKYGRDLTRLAREGKLSPCIDRKEEIKKVAQILLQKRKNNPLLVGDAGVGKTCIVEGLAQKIVQKEAPDNLKNLRIIEINMGSLVAGTIYRGQFEERLENVIKEASSNPDIVLFIDEIHTIMGAGAASSALDAANILKPALARGDIKCIGATTTNEYRKYIEKDPALERRFQVVWVEEPTPEEALEILKGLREGFEKYYKIKIPDKVLEKAVQFSVRYLTDFRLPDKAIDIIDHACSKKLLKSLSFSKGSISTGEELTIEDIATVVSERAKIPVQYLTQEESQRLLMLEEFLFERIKGQDHVVREVAESIRMAKAGFKDPKKPLSFAFFGPTGTGKTEFAKALAEFLFLDENKLITFDMSEYQQKHEVAKLLGSPPGYIGHEEEGLFSKKIRTNPYSVVLFDEVEKAHPDIFDLFLQILDEGRITDNHGKRINFSETIIVFTSNLGGRAFISTPSKKPIGFVKNYEEKKEPYEEEVLEAVKEFFKPEFLNRIQKILIFNPLTEEAVRQILHKVIKNLNKRLSSRGIEIFLDSLAEDFIIKRGYSETYGARELERTVDRFIAEPISKMILEGKLKEGAKIKVSLKGENLIFMEE
jgi:ATP-dependent Clp protease ATP-binding subunit ClpC